jgi:hypothetical protein
MTQDKQLLTVNLDQVLEKRRLDQALNAKEFAVLAGVSYATARDWFRLPGFPTFSGVVFWQDFVKWRNRKTEAEMDAATVKGFPQNRVPPAEHGGIVFTGKAAQILAEIG